MVLIKDKNGKKLMQVANPRLVEDKIILNNKPVKILEVKDDCGVTVYIVDTNFLVE